MKVIPSINCTDAHGAREKIETAGAFLPKGDFLHLDVTDGVFSRHKTWNDPHGWAALNSPFPLEVHLMVTSPAECADDWFVAGARRLIVHVETLSDEVLHALLQTANRHRGDLALTSNPETVNGELEPYVSRFASFQVLAVTPGAAGQAFLPFTLEKVRFLREASPDATIEVDGGMNPATAKLVKAAGADTIVAAHSIFGAPDPKRAYEELMNI